MPGALRRGPSRLPRPGGLGRGSRSEPSEEGKVGGFRPASDEAVDGQAAGKVWGKDGSCVTDKHVSLGSYFFYFMFWNTVTSQHSLEKSGTKLSGSSGLWIHFTKGDFY